MIDPSGPESHGVILVLPELPFAGEMLRKLRGLMAARRRAKEEGRVLLQQQGSAHQVRRSVRGRAGRGWL